MRKSVLIPLCIILFSFRLSAQSCTIKGNAFYKYNDFVGTRPDAGSTAYLFYKPSSIVKQAKCDVIGNFSFDNLQPGNYLLLVESKNTTSSPEEMFAILKYTPTSTFFNADVKDIYNTYADSIIFYQKKIDSLSTAPYLTNNKKKLERDNLIKKYNDAYIQLCKKPLQALSERGKDVFLLSDIITSILISFPKIEFKEITVTDKTPSSTSNVFDFGITYK